MKKLNLKKAREAMDRQPIPKRTMVDGSGREVKDCCINPLNIRVNPSNTGIGWHCTVCGGRVTPPMSPLETAKALLKKILEENYTISGGYELKPETRDEVEEFLNENK